MAIFALTFNYPWLRTDELFSSAKVVPSGKDLILDIGCGKNKRSGAIGIDRVSLPAVDVVHDLNETPWPFPDNTFDEVYAIHVIEHLDSILRTMEEIHRISRPHTKVTIVTPHHTDASSWRDPTHKWHLNSYSFNHFDPLFHTNFYTPVRFKISRRDVELASVWRLSGLQFLINLDNRFPFLRFTRRFWEHYLCFLVRGKQMTFLLEVIKRDSPVSAD